MKEILRANDVVLFSFACSLLDEAGVDYLALDNNMSVMEGSLGIIARRLLVPNDDYDRARRILREQGLRHELREP